MTEGQQEQPQEDVKPKINLVVDFEGQSECFLPRRVERPRRAATRRMHPPVYGCIRDPAPIYQRLKRQYISVYNQSQSRHAFQEALRSRRGEPPLHIAFAEPHLCPGPETIREGSR